MRRVLNYFSEVKLELLKVIWPKKEDVVKLTLVVLIISGIVAGYVGGLDFLLTNLLSKIVTK